MKVIAFNLYWRVFEAVVWGRVVVKALRYQSEGPGIDSRWCHWIFPSDQTMALGSTQPLVQMRTRNIPGGKGGRCVRMTTYHHTVPLSRILGALTSYTPLGLHGLLRVCFTFTFTFTVCLKQVFENPTVSRNALRRSAVNSASCLLPVPNAVYYIQNATEQCVLHSNLHAVDHLFL